MVIAVLALICLAVGGAAWWAPKDSHHQYLAATGWPATGQAAIAVGNNRIESSPDQPAAPIASIAKVMTAYVVLHDNPLPDGADGFELTVTAEDVADTAMRRKREESLVAVKAGETLTQRQALIALLLPSANNVAIMLARHNSGSVDAFVDQMNDAARKLGMNHTSYTDPSGYDESTVSTAADQVILAKAVMRDHEFALIVALTEYELPVAGTVRNTDTLLGTHGFVGIKTGSFDAAGGCFMFRTRRLVNGRMVDLTGVVLGQQGHDLIAAGLAAGAQLADRVAAT